VRQVVQENTIERRRQDLASRRGAVLFMMVLFFRRESGFQEDWRQSKEENGGL
jgi:hypothetical protein